MNRIYDYVTIGFCPHPEAGEFVIIGITVRDTMSGQIGYRLLPVGKSQRVHAMFPHDKAIYRDSRITLKSDLEYFVREAKKNPPDVYFQQQCKMLFSGIWRPTEITICGPAKGRQLAKTMQIALQVLYYRFVERKNL